MVNSTKAGTSVRRQFHRDPAPISTFRFNFWLLTTQKIATFIDSFAKWFPTAYKRL